MTKAERLAALTAQIAAARREYHRSLDEVCHEATGPYLARFDRACDLCNKLDRLAQDVAAADDFNPDAPMVTR